jgi:hypothetical protein
MMQLTFSALGEVLDVQDIGLDISHGMNTDNTDNYMSKYAPPSTCIMRCFADFEHVRPAMRHMDIAVHVQLLSQHRADACTT